MCVFFKLMNTESRQEIAERYMERVKMDSTRDGNKISLSKLVLYGYIMYNHKDGALIYLNNILLLSILFISQHSAEYLHSQIFTPITD